MTTMCHAELLHTHKKIYIHIHYKTIQNVQKNDTRSHIVAAVGTIIIDIVVELLLPSTTLNSI